MKGFFAGIMFTLVAESVVATAILINKLKENFE